MSSIRSDTMISASIRHSSKYSAQQSRTEQVLNMEQQPPEPGLSTEELERFHLDGYIGPFDLYEEAEMEANLRVLRPKLLNTKKAVYERFGIESYWIVVPDVDRPELIAFELQDGRYEQVAHVTGGQTFRAQRPFDVEIVPAHLVAGLLPG